jgi:acyl-coenzyme A thioesterase PaaI-like protein
MCADSSQAGTRSRESWRMCLQRWRFNLYPAYRGTGARIDFIADDWSEVRVRLPLNWRTRNIVGTVFGGSLYGAVDPIYMIQLMRSLGPSFIVWDKAATIRFIRPGRGTLYATFLLPAAEVESVRAETTTNGRAERKFTVDLVDASGTIHASCDKVLSIRLRERSPA